MWRFSISRYSSSAFLDLAVLHTIILYPVSYRYASTLSIKAEKKGDVILGTITAIIPERFLNRFRASSLGV